MLDDFRYQGMWRRIDAKEWKPYTKIYARKYFVRNSFPQSVIWDDRLGCFIDINGMCYKIMIADLIWRDIV